jgi:hypothetical protein
VRRGAPTPRARHTRGHPPPASRSCLVQFRPGPSFPIASILSASSRFYGVPGRPSHAARGSTHEMSIARPCSLGAASPRTFATVGVAAVLEIQGERTGRGRRCGSAVWPRCGDDVVRAGLERPTVHGTRSRRGAVRRPGARRSAVGSPVPQTHPVRAWRAPPIHLLRGDDRGNGPIDKDPGEREAAHRTPGAPAGRRNGPRLASSNAGRKTRP